MTYEVNPLYIKKLKPENPALGNLMPPRNISNPLVPIKSHCKSSHILEEGGPIKANLKYLGGGLV